MTDSSRDDHAEWEATVLKSLAAEPKWIAALNLLHEHGANEIRVGSVFLKDHSLNVAWYATATWHDDESGYEDEDAAGGRGPIESLLRLCKVILDGAPCDRCERPTVFIAEDRDYRMDWEIPDAWKPKAPWKQPLARFVWQELGCLLEWDLKTQRFVRKCASA